MIITIDGPAGTGKTTIAQQVALRLGFSYFDTGAMYRALTYALMKNSIDFKNPKKLEEFLNKFKLEIQRDRGKNRYFVDGEEVTEAIRTPEVTKNVSEIAASSKVRESLIEFQRSFGKQNNLVCEGRDMGTTIFPWAELKIFLTARAEVRAQRRYLEWKDKKMAASPEEIMQELLKRDHLDSTREASPLKQAEHAHLIDTSDMSIEEVVNIILSLIL